jgi:hypothetical protein
MGKKMVLKEIAKAKKPKPKLQNLKLHGPEYEAIKANADKYANGNISLWLRHAGIHHVPKQSELVKETK